jgi:hypothetical protein
MRGAGRCLEGMTLLGVAKREAPVRAEPHPTLGLPALKIDSEHENEDEHDW